MAPHSLADSHYDGPVNGEPSFTNFSANSMPGSDRLTGNQAPTTDSARKTSHLRSSSLDDVHDLICVGFGPASLSIAVALHDAIDGGNISTSGSSSTPKVLFLEKQPQFAWHAGMLLPGAKMQISFIKDMATLRDPTSKFTFLNYLHQNGRLVEFTNLSTFLPARIEYEDYLRWCAGFFDDVVRYGREVISVSPVPPADPTDAVSVFNVTSRNVMSGLVSTQKAKNVILAIGGQPSIPKCLPSSHPRVIHSSQYAHMVPKILNRPDAPYRVAVIGAGQSAAEIFNNVQTLYPNSQTSLIMRSEFLKPSDDSPFVNSIFNPSYVDSLYPRSAERRQTLLADARATNYGVVRLELIEHLYERMYHQRRDLGTDERKWPHRILGGTEIVGCDEHAAESDRLRLMVRPVYSAGANAGDGSMHDMGSALVGGEILDVDLVISATGYKRQSHLTMIEEMASLLPDAHSPAAKVNGVSVNNGVTPTCKIQDRTVKVARDYSVQFNPGAVAKGSGLWLQGCCEGTHGLSDTLLSILAVRSGEIVDSIFAQGQPSK
ncbi:L-ornithine 5-monooxygenase [Xylariaceae sp. FL0016]|nr:L-ornithine 5-monooxygenase [Xylariaceae sp. FL0016]